MTCGCHDSRFCGCCAGPAAHTPAPILNRPGLHALKYRVGVFSTFRQAMTDAISRDRRLDGLSVREANDMAISILESFAAIADVLSFYNERLINELFLRTALERDSIRRLVQLTGYRMRPGLAATTNLAFELDEGAAMTLRRGLKTMSVPGTEEVPVFFETLNDLEADADLNARQVFALPVAFNGFARGTEEAPAAYLPQALKTGDRLLFWGLEKVEEKETGSFEEARDGLRLRFSPAVQADNLWPDVARAARGLRRLRLFGHDAPESYSLYVSDPAIAPADRWQMRTIPQMVNAGVPLPLDRSYDDISIGDHLLIDAGPLAVPRLRTVTVTATSDASETIGAPGDFTGFRTETVTRINLRQTLRGAPQTAGRFHLARSGTGALLRMNRDAGETTWTLLSVAVSSDPQVTWFSGNFHVVSRAPSGSLLHHEVAPDGTTLSNQHGGALTSPPVSIATAGGTLRCFARGLNGALWMRRIGPAPGSWINLGGALTSRPALVETTPGHLHVFARGLDRGLWQLERIGGVWGTWQQLYGVLATRPVAIARASGSNTIAALDDKGTLILRRKDATGWRDWQTLGGALQGPPALVPGPNRLDVFAQGQDGALWHLARIGENWGNWTSLGGHIASPPSAMRNGNQIDLVARGRDGVLWERSLQGTAWGQWQLLGDGMSSIPDRREARIWQIDPEDLMLRDHDYPVAAEGSALALPLAPNDDLARLTRLFKNRPAILRSGGATHATQITMAQPFAIFPGTQPDHLRLGIKNPLPAPMTAPVLMANVARASHGETQRPEPLVGETSKVPLRTTRLRGAPLSYIADGTSPEGKPELDLRVGGVRWHPVSSLYGQGHKARVFTLRETTDGETEVAFGDGQHGAMPQGDPHAIQAIYRTGTGMAGRVRAGQLSVLLEKPPGLSAATNPLDASGAADPEPKGQARQNAPAQLRAFGRIVSLEDFVAVAKATGLVAKAHVTWVWQALERAAHLTVAGPEGAALTADDLALLHDMLNAARLPYRRLTIAGLTKIPVVVTARITPAVDASRDAAETSARSALRALFEFEHLDIGQAVHASAVYAALHLAPDVGAADVEVLQVKGYRDLTGADLAKRFLTDADLQPQISIFPARPLPADLTTVDPLAKAPFDGSLPTVLPAEQAFVQSVSEDIQLIVTEVL
jgi:hypothetical protein